MTALPAGELREAAAKIRERNRPLGPPDREFWLALADWLETVAADLDAVPPGCFMAYSPDPALATARAYMGTGSGQ